MLFPIPFVAAILFATSRTFNTFYIDGCNLMGNKGIPKNREMVIDKLLEIGAGRSDVILVFDGRQGDGVETKKTDFHSGVLSVVTTKEGLTADDYILQQISGLNDSGDRNRVIVTADRKMRKSCLAFKNVQVVNPVKFWKKYRTRLVGN